MKKGVCKCHFVEGRLFDTNIIKNIKNATAVTTTTTSFETTSTTIFAVWTKRLITTITTVKTTTTTSQTTATKVVPLRSLIEHLSIRWKFAKVMLYYTQDNRRGTQSINFDHFVTLYVSLGFFFVDRDSISTKKNDRLFCQKNKSINFIIIKIIK